MRESILETKMTVLSYIGYALKGFKTYPFIPVISSGIGLMLAWLTSMVAVNVSFIIVYIILSVTDWVTGIIASRVEKQDFKSLLFFKKPFLIGFCFIVLYILQLMITAFSEYPHVSNSIFESLLSTCVFLLETLKLGLLISFVIYELTSLRENFLRLKMKDFVKVVDVLLIPIQKINGYITSKFDEIIDKDDNNDTENKDNPQGGE